MKNQWNIDMCQLASILSSHPGQPAFWEMVAPSLALMIFLLGRWLWVAHHSPRSKKDNDPSLALLSYYVSRARRRARRRTAARKDDDLCSNDIWLSSSIYSDDQRRSVRREGMPIKVNVVDPTKPEDTIQGIVINRSATGLQIATTSALPVGSTLHIRSDNADLDTPWVKIIVRHSKQIDAYFESGCQFEDKLPWNVLLLFG